VNILAHKNEIKRIRNALRRLQKDYGGYTGQNLEQIAKEIKRSYLHVWRSVRGPNAKTELQGFSYLGRRKGSITSKEREVIVQRLSENCLYFPSYFLQELNNIRKLKKKALIANRTFYHTFSNILNDLGIDENDQFRWLKQNGIQVRESYSLENARSTLSSLFSFHTLANRSLKDIQKIVERLDECLNWMNDHYIGVNIPDYVNDLNLRKRKDAIPFQLSSIHADEVPEIQVRLIFETQVSTIIELCDFICFQLIFKHGRIEQQIRRKMPSLMNELWEKWASLRQNGQKKQLRNAPPVADEAFLTLLTKHDRSYSKLYSIICKLTDDFTSPFFSVHCRKSRQLIVAMKAGTQFDPIKTPIRGLSNKPLRIQRAEKDWRIRQALLTRLFIRYLKEGRITFSMSFYYQSLGKLIEQVGEEEYDGTLIECKVREVIDGTYPIKKEWFAPLNIEYEEDIDEDQLPPLPMVDYSDVVKVTSSLILKANDDWFEKHIQLFREMTCSMFAFTFSVAEFRDHLTHAIGFFGRNFKFRDDSTFMNSKYYFDRFVNLETIYLEHRFLYITTKQYWPMNDVIVIIDNKGDLGRKLSVLTLFHGRYLMVGYNDFRGVFPSQFPAFSCAIPCQETEAMNLCHLIDRVKNGLGSDIQAQTGDSHTTSNVSRALVFLAYDVISAGRFVHRSKKLESNEKSRLLASLPELLRVAGLIQRSSDYGRAISGRAYVEVSEKNIVDDLKLVGRSLHSLVESIEPDINQLCNLVESTNHQKRVARANERGRLRVSHRRVSIGLEGAELVLGNIFLYNCVMNKELILQKKLSSMVIQHVRLVGPR